MGGSFAGHYESWSGTFGVMLVGPKNLQAPSQPSQMATPTEFEAVHYAPPQLV
jgi:hypothetical protein